MWLGAKECDSFQNWRGQARVQSSHRPTHTMEGSLLLLVVLCGSSVFHLLRKP